MSAFKPYHPGVVVSVVVEVHGVVGRGAVALGDEVLREIDRLAVQDLPVCQSGLGCARVMMKGEHSTIETYAVLQAKLAIDEGRMPCAPCDGERFGGLASLGLERGERRCDPARYYQPPASRKTSPGCSSRFCIV